ncbi:MAG: hypothetical protein HPY66_2950 [Firmicutes bacterium]|nr:hypothetical protein [Bacillota bacterium]
MVRIRETLKSNGGNVYIWLIILVFTFAGVTALVFDFANLYIKSKQVKHAMNRATLAGALAVREGDGMADGVFLIDPDAAQDNFRAVLAHNLGLDETTLEPLPGSILSGRPEIKELAVENDYPSSYVSTTLGRAYSIEHPSVIAVVEFTVRGMLIRKTLVVDKLSGSQLTSVYD